MMFPVNRKATELTAVELLNLYDEARMRGTARSEAEAQAVRDTIKELRAEIERRLSPPTQNWQLQQQAQLR